MSLDSQPSRGMVLIVEDEPMILWDAEYIAEKAGFDVVSARNADEAIASLKAGTTSGYM
jgi:DNA-binding NtrC family response regulator